MLLWTQGCVYLFDLVLLLSHHHSPISPYLQDKAFSLFECSPQFSSIFLLFLNIPQQGHTAGAQLACFEHTRAMPVFQCFHLHWPLCVCVCVCAKLLQSCLTLCNSPPGSSDCRTSQARILEWVAMVFSRGSSRPRDQTCVPAAPALQADASLLSHQEAHTDRDRT